jgi:hypothetical protein
MMAATWADRRAGQTAQTWVGQMVHQTVAELAARTDPQRAERSVGHLVARKAEQKAGGLVVPWVGQMGRQMVCCWAHGWVDHWAETKALRSAARSALR